MPTELVSLADMKSYLGEATNTYDTFLTQQIQLVSSAIENYCSRKFQQATYTQTFYYSDYKEVRDKNKLIMFHYPLISITSIKEVEVYSTGNVETTLAATDYRMNNKKGYLRKFDEGSQEYWFADLDINSYVEVIYDAGFATVPPEIEKVVYDLVEQSYNKKVNGVAINFGADVQRVSIPGVLAVDFDYSLQANERKSKFGMILGNYANVLDYFRTERALIGEIKENYVA